MSPKQYDFLIVGAGLFGATVARELTDAGKRVLVIDRRSVVGGNVYSEKINGIEIHKYGPHILHANNDRIWQYIQRFTSIIPFTLRVKAMARGELYSFPINLETVEQIFGAVGAFGESAEELRLAVSVPRAQGSRDAESWVKEQVGERMYSLFIEGYTTKQWKRSPAELDESIVRRLPIRWAERNDEYFKDVKYQGLPALGYTEMVKKMLSNIEVRLGVNFLGQWLEWKYRTGVIIYSGALDELFGYALGNLDYRTTRFETEWHDGTYQGCSSVNHCDKDVPFTRTTEYKFFPPNDPAASPSAVVKEFPEEYRPGMEPHYPIVDARNSALAAQYIKMAESLGLVVGGRLGRFQYYDMDQVIASGIETARRLVSA